jgi:hypothetical protein
MEMKQMPLGKNEIEDLLIVAYVALTILQELNSSMEIPAFTLGSVLILWMMYDKIPLSLNRRFPDTSKAFAQDHYLKLGLVFFSSAMFTLFALNLYFGYFFLPRFLLGINKLELTQSIFGIVLLIFISIYYFSWKLWKYPSLAKQLWRETCWTDTEYMKEVHSSEKSRLYSLVSKYLAPGVIPMAVSAFLFMGWLVLSTVDLLMIGFLLLWLMRNLIFRTGLDIAFSRWKIIDENFVWNVITRVGISGHSGVIEAIMVIIGFVTIVFPSVMGWSTFVGIMICFNGWYILFVLFQIGLRSSARIRIDEHTANLKDATVRSLPRFVDLVLLWSFAMIVTFSLATSMHIHLNQTFAFIFVCLSVLLNLGSLATVIHWLKKQEKRYRLSEKTDAEILRLRKDLARDRYRLYSTIFLLGIPVVAAVGSSSALVLWSGIIGGLVFLCFDEGLRRRIQRKRAGVYASLLTAYLGLGVFTILGAAAYGLPELNTLLTQVGVLFAFLLAIYWVAVFRIKRRWKWN